MADFYDSDIAAWAEQQADALRRRAANEIDWENVAEEIEDVARRDRDRIYGALLTAITHLLKWQFQPEMRSGTWRSAIVRARDRIAKLVKDSPSLRSYPTAVLPEAYPSARRAAEAETVAWLGYRNRARGPSARCLTMIFGRPERSARTHRHEIAKVRPLQISGSATLPPLPLPAPASDRCPGPSQQYPAR